MPACQNDMVPRWRGSTAIALIDQRTVLLRDETHSTVLRGEAVAAVACLIDGQRSLAEIGDELSPVFGCGDVDHALDVIRRAGHLHDECLRQPSAVALSVIGIAPELPAQALSAAGLRVVPVSSISVDIELLVCSDLLDPQVERRIAQRNTSRPMLLVEIGEMRSLVGPLFDVDEGPCVRCFMHAIAWNRPTQRFMHERLGRPMRMTPPASSPGVIAAFALAAQSVCRAIDGDRSLRASVLAFDSRRGDTVRHVVRRRPQCPQCGDGGWMAAQGFRALALKTRRIVEKVDGGHRCIPPEETAARLHPLVSPITGTIQYLHPMPHRHTGMRQVYVAGYPLCPQVWPMENEFDKFSAGKGRSSAQARTSALCEGIERASGIWQGDEAVVWATRAELGEAAVAFDALQNFSAYQYSQRERLNAGTSDRRRQIPMPFSDDARIAWTPAWPLSGGPQRFVPLAYCFTEAPPDCGGCFGHTNPNGCAAGHVLEEAILQGVLELIERDAIAIWWYHRIRRPALELDGIDDLFVQQSLADYVASGWSVHVLDLTHDLGIPVFAAVAHHAAFDRPAIGFGCHLQGSIALSRALTELNQLMDERPNVPSPWDRNLLPDTEFLEPFGTVSELLSLSSGEDLLDDLEICRQRLKDAGLDVLVVDKTRPDFGLAVVQVIVPGLRHFWPRFGPGRLYEVPVTLGWMRDAGDEADLNPAPLFL